jgi:hypothetical protein
VYPKKRYDFQRIRTALREILQENKENYNSKREDLEGKDQ